MVWNALLARSASKDKGLPCLRCGLRALRDDHRLPSNHQCIPISHVRKAGASPRRGLPEIARDRAARPLRRRGKAFLVEGKRVRRFVPKKWHTIRKEKGKMK